MIGGGWGQGVSVVGVAAVVGYGVLRGRTDMGAVRRW